MREEQPLMGGRFRMVVRWFDIDAENGYNNFI